MLTPKSALEVRHVASDDKTREVINAVRLEENGTKGRAVSTNGRCLLRATWDLISEGDFIRVDGALESTEKTGLLSVKDAEAIAKGLPRKQNLPVLENARIALLKEEKAQAIMVNKELSPAILGIKQVPGNFPNYEQVIPRAEKVEKEVTFNIDDLACILKALENAGAARVTLGFTKDPENHNPVRITAKIIKTGMEFDGAIMPGRDLK